MARGHAAAATQALSQLEAQHAQLVASHTALEQLRAMFGQLQAQAETRTRELAALGGPPSQGGGPPLQGGGPPSQGGPPPHVGPPVPLARYRELQLELRSWRSHELDFLLEWADRDADRCVILAKYLECSHGQLT